MVQSHERSIKPLLRWPCPIKIPGKSISKSDTAFFPTQQLRQMTCRKWPNSRRLTENGQILEVGWPTMAKKSRKMIYRDWLNLNLRQAGIGQAPEPPLSWSGVTS